MTSQTDQIVARNRMARIRMVDSQIRPVRVRDPRILDAMRSLPRELFVPERLACLAYIDTCLDLGGGRAMLEPRVLARLVQIAAPRAGERALVVGSGTGYGAALLAFLGLSVTALEQDASLLAIARSAVAAVGLEVAFREAPIADGLPGETFDLVLIEGGVELIPAAIERTVSEQGRLITVRIDAGASLGQGVIGEQTAGGLSLRSHFDAAARLLPGFVRPTGFRF